MVFLSSTRLKRRLFIAFVIAFIASVIVSILISQVYYYESSMVSEYTIDSFQYSDIDSGQLLLHVAFVRIIPYLLIGLFGIVLIGNLFVYTFAIWYGSCCGFVLTTCVLTYGVKGTFLFLACLFPHYIVYLPVFCIALVQAWGMWNYLFQQDRSMLKGNYEKAQVFTRYILSWLIGFFFLISGFLLESYVNVGIMNRILKLF